jgi:hypothetical protein
LSGRLFNISSIGLNFKLTEKYETNMLLHNIQENDKNPATWIPIAIGTILPLKDILL